MTKFKKQVAKDLETVFFNENEFAEWLDLDGTKILGFLSYQTFKEKYLTQAAEIETGLYQNGVTLVVASKYLEILPQPTNIVILTGIEYQVVDSRTNEGIHYIDLVRLED